MISRYSQIQQQVSLISPWLKEPGHVQKIYSTSRYLALGVRVKGKNLWIYLGRSPGFEGLWLGEKSPESRLRCRDRWLEWCRKKFSSALILSIEMDPLDRAICLTFQRQGERFSLHLAWIGRQVHFASWDEKSSQWFLGWGAKLVGDSGFEVFNELGRREITKESVEKPLPNIEALLDLEAKRLEESQLPKVKIKSQEKKLQKIEQDLAKIRGWHELEGWLKSHQAEELAELKELKVSGRTYKLPPELGAWQKRDWLFNQLKRLRRAEEWQQKRLEDEKKKLGQLMLAPREESNPLRPTGPVWQTGPERAPVASTQMDYVIHTLNDCQIGVGVSAHGNDQLRKHWAHAEDLWLHALHGKSAHAVIKTKGGGAPTVEMIQQAAILLAKQSRITATEIDVVMCLVKHVRGVTGAAGMVLYKKSKILRCLVTETTE